MLYSSNSYSSVSPSFYGKKVIGDRKPLKYNWSGFWSRRITKEHRLVYAVEQDSILIAQCRFHYFIIDALVAIYVSGSTPGAKIEWERDF
ncbi:MAG: Txe/YoeB family addiction module toxin [Xenococcaceae cyanobacterium MO_188.B32]|nr:Txe/YoeB family addiction module toxin [Xenococcaceae cyanobacterium MO_188.B32]